MTHFLMRERSHDPFDILFRDFFNSNANFNTLNEVKHPHPVDIFEDPQGLHFEIACTGLSKEDINIDIEGDILKVSYSRPKGDDTPDSEDRTYLAKSIARRSFNLGYKVATRFDLIQATASMQAGLLHISIPFAEASKPRSLKIK